MGSSRKILLVSSVLSISFVALVNAQIQNGGFETGDFTGWTTAGATAVVNGTFDFQAPAEGSFQAVMSAPFQSGTVSQSALETFLELNQNTLDTLNGSATFRGGSAIAQVFTVADGAIISFSWDFVTNGSSTASDQNDSAFFTLHLSGSNSSSFTILDQTSNHPGFASGYQTFVTGPLAAGTYILGFADYDRAGGAGSDDRKDPDLLIDNVQVIPEPSTWLLLTFGGLIAFLFARRRFA